MGIREYLDPKVTKRPIKMHLVINTVLLLGISVAGVYPSCQRGREAGYTLNSSSVCCTAYTLRQTAIHAQTHS